MRRRFGRRHVLVGAGVVAVAAVAAYLLHDAGGGDGFDLLGQAQGGWAYVAVFVLVFGDAICALLPGETTLNTAATLAAQGALELWSVVLAGALGAIVGDSSVFWIARAGSRRFAAQVDQVREDTRVQGVLSFMGTSAPLLLVLGRYVPGLRLAVNVTMGASPIAYRRFLLWSSVGGTLWSVYTCVLAYLVATALSGFPLASIVISGAITTLALTAVYVAVRRRRRARTPGSPGSGEARAPSTAGA
jgi:membrane protein DedA with SNARE-associated domain